MKLLLFAFGLFSCFAFGQHYQMTYRFDSPISSLEIPTTGTAYLYVDTKENKSLYEVDASSVQMISNDSRFDSQGKSLSLALGNVNKVNLVDYASDSIYSTQLFLRKIFLVKEKKPNLTWQLSSETKKTKENITLQKATTSFRGRTYTAWYSPEKALPYGPFKFNGLPGLIYELYDATQKYHWALTQVKEVEKLTKIPLLQEIEHDHEVSLKEFITARYKGKKTRKLAVPRNLPRGMNVRKVETIVDQKRRGIETKFEWEE